MLLSLVGILAMSQPSTEGQGQPFWGTLVMMGIIFVLFYFLLIAPARKKQKKHAEMVGNLKAGDKIITNGGIHGTVVGVTESVIQVKIADQVKIDISKNAVAGLQQPS
jgi:preprotein translocase subunit YajC